MAMLAPAAAKGPWTTSCLIAVIAIQWVLFTALLQYMYRYTDTRETITNTGMPTNTGYAGTGSTNTLPRTFQPLQFLEDTKRYILQGGGEDINSASSRPSEQDNAEMQSNRETGRSTGTEQSYGYSYNISGVAATVIFRAPKWFFLRYKVMLDNALANLPDETWKLQVFINEPWVRDQLLPWHPGLKRMFEQNPRVIVTALPTNLIKGKPRDVFLSTWFWQSMAADRVILFSGNGAFCGNQPAAAWDSLLSEHLDYAGAPCAYSSATTDPGGCHGGDGSSHSLRNRNAMLRVLRYTNESTNKNNHRAIQGPEHRYFLDTMMQMNREIQVGSGSLSPPLFRIATPEQTVTFGGVYNLSNNSTDPQNTGLLRLPLTVAGTQARLTYQERDSLLKHCPELKVIFPSLHEPACFGAHPDGETCKATICALQEHVPSHGC